MSRSRLGGLKALPALGVARHSAACASAFVLETAGLRFARRPSVKVGRTRTLGVRRVRSGTEEHQPIPTRDDWQLGHGRRFLCGSRQARTRRMDQDHARAPSPAAERRLGRRGAGHFAGAPRAGVAHSEFPRPQSSPSISPGGGYFAHVAAARPIIRPWPRHADGRLHQAIVVLGAYGLPREKCFAELAPRLPWVGPRAVRIGVGRLPLADKGIVSPSEPQPAPRGAGGARPAMSVSPLPRTRVERKAGLTPRALKSSFSPIAGPSPTRNPGRWKRRTRRAGGTCWRH